MGDMFAVGGCDCTCDSSSCTVSFCVTAAGGINISGATVSIYNNSGLGTLIGSCTTIGSGCCTINVGASGTYWAVVSATGYTSFAGSETVACNGTTTFSLTNTSSTCAGCISIPTTLHATLLISGSGCSTLANGTVLLTQSGAAWYCNSPGHPCYGGGTIAIACIGNVLNTVFDGTCEIPATSVSCTPSFSATFVLTSANCPNIDTFFGCSPGSTYTWTVTP